MFLQTQEYHDAWAKAMEKVVYTNHSGGAIGADSYWDSIGREFGVTDHLHYWHSTRTPKGNFELTDQQIEEAWPHVLKANEWLQRKGIERFKSLLARNYYQVLNADAVFAIGELQNAFAFIPKGGTAWAVQMAKDMGKPVYFFDQKSADYTFPSSGWSLFDRTARFIQPNEVKLTQNFAGIGSRKITPAGIQAIRDVYQNTFKPRETTNN